MPEELQLLKAISCEDVHTFLPAGRSADQARAFDALVASLEGLERLGWIELEAAKKPGRCGTYERIYVAAVAHCTAEGKRALQLLGEAAQQP